MTTKTKPTYIIVTENNTWGSSTSLSEAANNACLYQPGKPSDFFANLLDIEFSTARLEEARLDWDDYGQEETMYPEDDPVRIRITKFDPELWEDWHVDGIDGAVTFSNYKGEHPTPDRIPSIPAIWNAGVITPRKEK